MLRFWTARRAAHEARERLAAASSRTGSTSRTGRPAPVAGAPPPATTAVSTEKLTVGRTLMAFLPYLVVIVVFSLAKLWTPLKNFLAGTDMKIGWPGPDGNILTVSRHHRPPPPSTRSPGCPAPAPCC